METTMKAAVVNHPCDPSDRPCNLETVTKPEPKEDEVLVQLLTAGVCHTDVHAIAGDWVDKAKFPLIPGHEGVGIIASKGKNVQRFEIGDRVGIPWLFSACGACEYCINGNETVCPHQQISGFTAPGCMSEYVIGKAAFVERIPDSLSSEEAAPVLCAGLTAYKAIKRTEACPGQFLAVVGAAGGIGHMACQYGKAMGLRVIAIDVGEYKKTFCESLGVELALNSTGSAACGESVAELVRKVTGGGAHGVVCCATHPVAFKSAIQMSRTAGTVVCVGLCPGDMEVPIVDLVQRTITIRGSMVGTRQDLREALGFAERGQVKCRIVTDALENVNEVLGKLVNNEIQGRVVLQM